MRFIKTLIIFCFVVFFFSSCVSGPKIIGPQNCNFIIHIGRKELTGEVKKYSCYLMDGYTLVFDPPVQSIGKDNNENIYYAILKPQTRYNLKLMKGALLVNSRAGIYADEKELFLQPLSDQQGYDPCGERINPEEINKVKVPINPDGRQNAGEN